MLNKDYIPQIDESDCGAACLAMILKHYNSDVSIAYIRNLAHTNTEGNYCIRTSKNSRKIKL